MFAYTDGSCSHNPGGVGAWAYVIVNKEKKVVKTQVGKELCTTSNRMELKAILEALKDFPEVEYVCSDSQYSVNCCSNKWKAKANLDLIQAIKSHCVGKKLSLLWVRGHNGDEFNEMADYLCGEEMKEAFLEKYGFPFQEYNAFGRLRNENIHIKIRA